MGARERIDRRFEAWGRAVYRRPRRVIAAVIAGVAALGAQIPDLRIETSLDKFLRADDPLRVTYDAFREEFGRDDLTLLAIETSDVFSRASLERLRDLHRALEADVPHVYEVTSLVNARETWGEGDRLVVSELLEDWPESEAEREALRRRALANRFYRNLFVSEDARFTVVLVESDTWAEEVDVERALAGFDEQSEAPPPARAFSRGEEDRASVLAIAEIVARHQHDDFHIRVTGAQPMAVFLQQAMERDMLVFTALGIATIAVGLALLFRRAAGVLLPLGVVVLSVVATMGFLALIRFPIGMPTQILPSFLLAVGVGYAVHILAIFFQGQARGAGKEEAIVAAVRHSGSAVALTALTTAGALASFASSPLAPVEALGYAAPGGVAVAFFLSVTLLPAFVAVLPIGAAAPASGGGDGPTQRLLVACGRFSVRHAASVSLVCVGGMALSLLAASQVRFGHDPLSWFPAEHPFRAGMERVNDRLGGSIFLEVLLDTQEENGLHDPALLARIDALHREVSAIDQDGVHAGKTLSIVDVLKEINQALHGNRADAHRLPGERELVAQELLLFENSGSDDLEDVADSRFRVGRLTLKTPFLDAHAYPPYLARVEEAARRILGPGVAVQSSGLLVILSGTMGAVTRSLVSSYAIAFCVILVLMVVMLGELRLGLLSMLPNLAPIALTLALMGVLGIPLDTFALLIGSIAIGLAVDDTIHFMHHFRRYYDECGDVEEAVAQTLRTAGQAMFFTTIVLTAGFLIYLLASMNNLFVFGLLTAVTIAAALLADLTLAPALVTIFARRRNAPAAE